MRPDVFAAVMATGIVSIAAADHGFRVVSQLLLVAAAAALPVLVVMVAKVWRRLDFSDADVGLGLFTYVAACTVLAARLAEYRVVLSVLAAIALQGWLSLTPIVIRRVWPHRARARGGWELASVATAGLAIVSAELKVVFLAVLFWVLAVALYVLMTSLIVWRAIHDPARLELAQPDMWILMGGAAIATLAGDHIHKAGLQSVWPVTVVTWVVATLWIPPLVYVGLRKRVGISWPAVFPLGMYSSATYAMFVETGWWWFTAVSEVFFWIALAAWVWVTASQSRVLSRR